jgi:hypothetical protein
LAEIDKNGDEHSSIIVSSSYSTDRQEKQYEASPDTEVTAAIGWNF